MFPSSRATKLSRGRQIIVLEPRTGLPSCSWADSELERHARLQGERVGFNREARAAFLRFATSSEASWPGNFRDLGASVTRMATLAESGRITLETVQEEIGRLRRLWAPQRGAREAVSGEDSLIEALGEAASELDRFDRVQLADVLRVCRECRSLSEAGRRLFNVSRERKRSSNDADRLRKYLARFGLNFESSAARP